MQTSLLKVVGEYLSYWNSNSLYTYRMLTQTLLCITSIVPLDCGMCVRFASVLHRASIKRAIFFQCASEYKKMCRIWWLFQFKHADLFIDSLRRWFSYALKNFSKKPLNLSDLVSIYIFPSNISHFKHVSMEKNEVSSFMLVSYLWFESLDPHSNNRSE